MQRLAIGAAAGMGAILAMQSALAGEVKIGVQISMTGPLATVGGKPLKSGIELALKEIADTHFLGSDTTLAPILTDNASDKTQSITLTSKLCSGDNVAIMIGPMGSTAGAAAAPVANELKCPSIMFAVSPEVTRDRPWVYKAYDNPTSVMQGVGDYIIKLKPHTVHLVYNNDNPATVDYRNALTAILKASGITDITEDTILSAQTDFTALATKLADLNPDVLFIGTPPEGSANLVIQARQAGLSDKVKIVGSDYFTSPAFARIGGAAVEGVVYPTHSSAARSDDYNKAYVKDYTAAYGIPPDSYASVAYNATWAAARAIKAAGDNPTREKIREALLNIKDADSVMGMGKMSIDDQRSVRYQMLMATIANGKETILPSGK
jgi:branched-chain amino acid transport system substrate-binding protein